ncbi:relaxase, partial [Gottfriedia acidiceleris]
MVATVKVLRYIKYNGTPKPIHSAKEHIKYIEADREKHRTKPVLFNGKEDKVDRKEFFKLLEEQPKNCVVIHKMVLTMSEDEQKRLKIDMKELARDTMASFETKIGKSLRWCGAYHDD